MLALALYQIKAGGKAGYAVVDPTPSIRDTRSPRSTVPTSPPPPPPPQGGLQSVFLLLQQDHRPLGEDVHCVGAGLGSLHLLGVHLGVLVAQERPLLGEVA